MTILCTYFLQITNNVSHYRCPLTCIDQETGEKKGDEPLRTLRSYRLYEQLYSKDDERFRHAPLFGCHCSVIKEGPIQVGDIVYVRPQ